MKCSVCQKQLSHGAKSGLCRAHFNARMASDPAVRAKRSERLKAYFRDNPGKGREMAIKSAAVRLTKPENVKRLRDQMRAIQPLSYTPERLADRDYAARAAKCRLSDQRLAWCPQEHRAEYRRLTRKKKLTPSEAREIVMGMVGEAKAKEATLSPFERQERALRNGAGIQDNVRLDRFSASATELRQKLA